MFVDKLFLFLLRMMVMFYNMYLMCINSQYMNH